MTAEKYSKKTSFIGKELYFETRTEVTYCKIGWILIPKDMVKFLTSDEESLTSIYLL